MACSTGATGLPDGEITKFEDLTTYYKWVKENKNKIEAQMAAMASVLAEYVPQLAWGKYEDPKAAIDEMRGKYEPRSRFQVYSSEIEDMIPAAWIRAGNYISIQSCRYKNAHFHNGRFHVPKNKTEKD